MTKHLTFSDIPVGGLFVTGPTERLYIKLDNEEGLPNVPGGNSRDIVDGVDRRTWFPYNRIVNFPARKHFTAAAKEYHWNRINEAEQSKFVEEASRY